MKIEASLTLDTVVADKDTDAHLVVSLTAPACDEQARPKLAVVMCFDVSSSMSGHKLEQAKQSAFKMIDHLRPDDVLGVVTFGSDVKVIIRPSRLGSTKEAMRKAIAALRTDGMTNFAGGMVKSLDLLKELDLGSNYIHRVIMLTDGVANVGAAKIPADIIKLLTANMEHITCSAFGYGGGTGHGEFDPDFLTAFAKEGKGNYAHIEDPDKALQAFGKELGGLISTYATDVTLELKSLNGHTIEKVISDVDVDEENTGEVYVRFPDLLAEETRHIVVAVKLAKQSAHGPRPVNVFEVKATYQTFDATGKRQNHSEGAKAKVQFVKDGEPKVNPALADIVGLAQLVRAQLEAETQAKRGDFVAAAAVMHNAESDFGKRGLQRLAATSAKIALRVQDAGSYSANAGYLRSFERGATRGLGVSSYAGGADMDLMSLGVQMSNSMTTATSNAFAGGVLVAPVSIQAPLVDLTAPRPLDGEFVLFAAPGSLPVPNHETNKDDGTKKPSMSSRKHLKQSRKSW